MFWIFAVQCPLKQIKIENNKHLALQKIKVIIKISLSHLFAETYKLTTCSGSKQIKKNKISVGKNISKNPLKSNFPPYVSYE